MDSVRRHRIKNALVPIRASAQMLKRKVKNDIDRKHLNFILDSVKRIINILDEEKDSEEG